jgi:hypothetical protein
VVSEECRLLICRVDLVRTDILDELSASIIRVTIIELLTLAVTSNRRASANFPSSPILVRHSSTDLMFEGLTSLENLVCSEAVRSNMAAT